MKRASIQDLITRTSTGNGSPIDISTYTDTSLTVVTEVTNLTPGTEARLSLQTSTDGFATILEGPVISVLGAISNSACLRFSFRIPRDFCDFQSGVGSAFCRLSLTRLTGASPSISYVGFLEVAAS